jgi:hypothetical protein
MKTVDSIYDAAAADNSSMKRGLFEWGGSRPVLCAERGASPILQTPSIINKVLEESGGQEPFLIVFASILNYHYAID